MKLRKEVRLFAEAMERRLQANDHKPGWKDDTPDALLDRVDDELLELHMAVATGKGAILLEAADVANFLMMVVDVCGELKRAKRNAESVRLMDAELTRLRAALQDILIGAEQQSQSHADVIAKCRDALGE